MTTRIAFRRVVLGLQQSTPDQMTVRLAAELAGLLKVDLCGLFIEDPEVAVLAGRQGAREYRILGNGWRDLDAEGLSREIDQRARLARRRFDEMARRLGISCRFEIARAAIGEALRTSSAGGDIVIIAEPRDPLDRSLAGFAELVRAAFRSQADVLYVPRRVLRGRGPVVAVAGSPDDPSIAVASALAVSARESLVILQVDGEPGSAEAPWQPEGSQAMVPVGRLRVARRALGDIRSLSAALDGLGERMIVVSRDLYLASDDGLPLEFATLRGVPVLMVEPRAAAEARTQEDARATGADPASGASRGADT